MNFLSKHDIWHAFIWYMRWKRKNSFLSFLFWALAIAHLYFLQNKIAHFNWMCINQSSVLTADNMVVSPGSLSALMGLTARISHHNKDGEYFQECTHFLIVFLFQLYTRWIFYYHKIGWLNLEKVRFQINAITQETSLFG